MAILFNLVKAVGTGYHQISDVIYKVLADHQLVSIIDRITSLRYYYIIASNDDLQPSTALAILCQLHNDSAHNQPSVDYNIYIYMCVCVCSYIMICNTAARNRLMGNISNVLFQVQNILGAWNNIRHLQL